MKSLEYKINRIDDDKGRLRLYLGEFVGGDFNVTIETIKLLPTESQYKLRNYIKNTIIQKMNQG